MYSDKYDHLFKKYSDGLIPVEYLRVLSYSESSLNPNTVNPSSNATGLFQVVSVVLKDWNRNNHTNYTMSDMKDPDLNCKVGINLLKGILKKYSTIESLKPNWQDRRFIELYTQGFNAGYNGVVKIAQSLQRDDVIVNVDTVRNRAETLYKNSISWAKYLADKKRVLYAKAVADRYFREIGNPPSSGPTQPVVLIDDHYENNRAKKVSKIPAPALAVGGFIIFIVSQKRKSGRMRFR